MTGSDDLMAGLADLEGARGLYNRAWEYWRCDVPEQFDSPAVRRALARSAGKFALNIAKIPIVALSDRLKVTAMTAIGEDGQKDPEADDALQERVIAANKLGLQTKRLIRNTLIFGDSYLFIWRGDDDPAGGTVTVAYNDPRICRVIYDAADELRIDYAIKQWVERGQSKASILYADRLELGWVLRPGEKPDQPSSWEREAAAEDVPNDYGRVPVFHFRTDLPYGTAEHEDAWGAQDAVKKLSASLSHSAERTGLRDRWFLTEPNASINGIGGDSPDWDDDGDADESNRDDSQLRSGAGEVNVLEGIKSVGEWSAPDPTGFMGPADWYTRYAALITRTPGRYADPGGQHPSGSALRVADAPLASKTDDRQEFLDGELRDAMAFALDVVGFPGRRVDVRWKPPGIVDDVDTWEIADAKMRAGVPMRVALAETGLYEQDEIDGWLADASVEMDVARRIDLLSTLGAAVQQLGQGVALGLLGEEQAKAIIDTTIGQLTPDVTPDGP